jgi:Carboxypeptidase regulatory-like domain
LLPPYLKVDNGCVRRATAITLTCAFFVTSAKAVRELVVIKELQQAQQVEGFVLDPSGAPIPDMTVTDRSEQWVAILRSTTTDSKGHFRFARQRGKTVYYLRFDDAAFNPLELRLKLDKTAPQRAITARPEIGG